MGITEIKQLEFDKNSLDKHIWNLEESNAELLDLFDPDCPGARKAQQQVIKLIVANEMLRTALFGRISLSDGSWKYGDLLTSTELKELETKDLKPIIIKEL